MEPKTLLLCQPSNQLDEAWKRLYEGAFPAVEREPAYRLARLIADGSLLYHRTVNEAGELLCFTMVSVAPGFCFLAYMATDPTKRSGGIGTKHLLRLIESLKERYPKHLGLFLEIEATAPRGEVLSEEERINRLRRRKFYEERIGARVLCQDVPYLTPRFGSEKGKEWEGELLAIEFDEPVCQGDLTKVICEIYERFYLLPPNHPLVLRVLKGFTECQHTCDLAEDKDGAHGSESAADADADLGTKAPTQNPDLPDTGSADSRDSNNRQPEAKGRSCFPYRLWRSLLSKMRSIAGALFGCCGRDKEHRR